MVTITIDEYRIYTGIDLSVELRGLDDDSNKIDRAIRLWTQRVYREARRNSIAPIPPKEKLLPNQIQAIKDAICEYGEYYLKNGDLYRQSGFSEENGVMVDSHSLDKLRFPQVCLDILRQNGLIKRSIGRMEHYNQDFDNEY